MNKPYIYESTQHMADRAVIVLPEIFGVTEFIKRTTDRFANEFKLPAFALDHFYGATGKDEVLDYQTGMQRGVEIMQQMTGEGFYSLFKQALDEIQASYPEIKQFIVCGFCFGGRLAYLAGMDKRVSQVVSFYGAQPHLPNYFEGKSPVEALAQARGGDASLRVLSFYGGKDESIPEDDRATTKQLLDGASIDYLEKVYGQAGHAYFNDSRPERYDSGASEESWEAIKDFLN